MTDQVGHQHLEGEGLFSAQLDGGQAHPINIQIDITGTAGVLRSTNAHAFQNPADDTVEAVNGDGTALAELCGECRDTAKLSLDEIALDVAPFAAYARDTKHGASEAAPSKTLSANTVDRSDHNRI
jgi:hypothetical protein